ncbi:hypothetical protein BQ8482_130089 [Mesorhizobium delmotii]|uniref:Uncharacterized protein n=1 Tax=Mesorhizobium delmotii TaxID=1631247 RepID=A0A2P9AGF8_9HYPH|nr:hypothetical protein BQ8482_130089 [Mesorhizobium delmotii]
MWIFREAGSGPVDTAGVRAFIVRLLCSCIGDPVLCRKDEKTLWSACLQVFGRKLPQSACTVPTPV